MPERDDEAWLGIDLGTTKIAAVVIDGRTRATLAVERAPIPGRLAAPPGRSEWDAEQMLAAAMIVAAGAVRKAGSHGAKRIGGIGVSNQMHGMVLMDRAGHQAITPFIGWQDQRALEPLPGGRRGVGALVEMQERLAPLGRRRTGCRPAPGYAATTLFWLARTGALPHGARAVSIGDCLVARLCGRAAVTDPTNGAGMAVLDVVARRWDAPTLDALGLTLGVLPDVIASGAVVGHVNGGIAAVLGVLPGTPVANAVGDNQASVLGSLADPQAELLVNVGTGAQLSAVVPEHHDLARAFDHPVLEVRPHVAGAVLLAGARTAGGSAYAVVAALLRAAAALASQGEAPEDDVLYATLGRLAAAVPAGSDGLQCDPAFFGEREAPERRGAFTGVRPENLTPGHLARATLEGVASSLADVYEAMEELGAARRSRVVGAGNALRRSPLLVSLLEARLGMPLTVCEHEEEAARGAALLALAGISGTIP